MDSVVVQKTHHREGDPTVVQIISFLAVVVSEPRDTLLEVPVRRALVNRRVLG